MIKKCLKKKVGYASIDEHGKVAGGNDGNQTGKELKIREWYDFGQTMVFRWKDTVIAKRYAQKVWAACKNPNIGYNQARRATLNAFASENGYKLSKIENKCACDCSSLVAVCLRGVNLDCPVNVTTGTLPDYLSKCGYFIKLTGERYTRHPDNLKKGDIIIKPFGHVVSVVSK